MRCIGKTPVHFCFATAACNSVPPVSFSEEGVSDSEDDVSKFRSACQQNIDPGKDAGVGRPVH
jgi:hypothetical protein